MNICIGLSLKKFEKSNLLRNLAKLEFLSSSKVTWVHCFQRQKSLIDLPEHLKLTQTQEQEVVENLLSQMKEFTNGLLPDLVKQNYFCFVCDSRKEAFVQYCLETSPDIVLITCKNKSGIENLFSSSFAEYMQENLPFNTLLLK